MAQLGSAPALGAGGRRFESYLSDHVPLGLACGDAGRQSEDPSCRLPSSNSVGQSIVLIKRKSVVQVYPGGPHRGN